MQAVLDDGIGVALAQQVSIKAVLQIAIDVGDESERYARTRKFNSIGLQVVILAACFTSWCSYISWYWSVTPFLHQPWFYIGGIAVTAVCIFNLVKCARLPKYDPATDKALEQAS